jgi:glycosyltransferase involved in cell wall biosynthesis
MNINKKKIVIIIPCYKEQDRLPQYLSELKKFVSIYDLQFVIVDDGSPEVLYNKLKLNIEPYLSESIVLLHYPTNKGKGFAISYGIDNSNSEIIGFLDADGSIPDYEVGRLINQFINEISEIDMLIASRIMILGKKINRKFHRHFMGRIFISYLNYLFPMKVYDSQCGLKLFKRQNYEIVKNQIHDFRWLWDTQLLILFYYNHFKNIEVPIDWNEIGQSRVNIFKDSALMFMGLIKFKKKIKEYGY